jgi:hypothetical protein
MGNRNEGTGITNRDINEEKRGQDYVTGNVSEMEAEGLRDDLNTDDRNERDLPNWQRGRNIAPDNSQGDHELSQGADIGNTGS